MPLSRGEEQVTFWLDVDWQAEGRAFAAANALPFQPIAVRSQWKSPEGRDYGSLIWSSPNVSDAGRCGIYETRPDLCRQYEAGSDRLCVMMPPTNQEYPREAWR